MNNMNKKAIIIGAGPAGLTAAYELLKRTDITPIILEKSGDIGGISKTINYKGNRMDIGGHRFFSKSDRVMDWWLHILPLQEAAEQPFTIQYQHKSREVRAGDGAPDEMQDPDKVMLVRRRLSRIYFLRRFFTYPITLSVDTLRKLGIGRTIAILFSYLKAQLFPRKPEKSLEDFMINRFGTTLYHLFFKDYTEKVWGVPCHEIPAEWGAQRIKGVSILKAIQHAVQEVIRKKKGDIAQKGTETSLIEQFLYPKYGPGQLWEEVARQVQEMGGIIHMHHDVKHIYTSGNNVTAVTAVDNLTGASLWLEGDYFFSTMPVKELIAGMGTGVPAGVQEVAAGLQYRDFITVGILLSRLSFQDKHTGEWKPLSLKDTWIYIQEKDVKVGRLQLFNNWSPFMVKDPDTVWVGMEFFCNITDDFWKLPDGEIAAIAIRELEKIGLATAENVLDSTVLRVEKTYPAYFGAYERFDEIRAFVDRFENLFLVGRNGMHKYNNADHSMLTAMVAVDNIVEGVVEKENIWGINTEQEYHEEKAKDPASSAQYRTGAPPSKIIPSFRGFLLKNTTNKVFLWGAGIAIILQLTVFKYLYPYASFINGDSYVYLQAAHFNTSINTYPIGYSKFLRLFSVFSKSDTALVAFQYISLEVSNLLFLFTLFFFYRPGRVVQLVLLIFLILNPAFLYLSNYISSDAIFFTLSLTWLTSLLWIANSPSNGLICIHGLLLFLSFTVRYNALYYPVISGIAFLLSNHRRLVRIIGLTGGIALIGVFMLHTSSKYYELVGIKQFSPFSGWQMANNALYAYRYVDSMHIKPVPARFRQLDSDVRTYFDTTRDVLKHPQEMLLASTVYMWDPRSPLQHYMSNQPIADSTIGKLKQWAVVGPLYADYGSYLIRQYPVSFLKYYLWPNALKYYAPPVEFLESYSTGKDSVQLIAQAWFGYKTNKIKTRLRDFKVNVLNFYPILAGALNVAFLFVLLSIVILKGHKHYPTLKGSLLLVAFFWLINFVFSVFASPIALRFQLFPIVIFMSFTLLFIEYILKILKQYETKHQELRAGIEDIQLAG